MLNAGLTYDILDWLNVSARIRVDNTDNTYQQKLYASTISTLTEGSTQGHYTIQKVNETQTYADFMVNINKRIDDFTVVVNAGTSLSDNSSDLLGYGGPIRDTECPTYSMYLIWTTPRNGQHRRFGRNDAVYFCQCGNRMEKHAVPDVDRT